MTRRQIIQEQAAENHISTGEVEDFFNFARREWPEMDHLLDVELLEENLAREKRNCEIFMTAFLFGLKLDKAMEGEA